MVQVISVVSSTKFNVSFSADMNALISGIISFIVDNIELHNFTISRLMTFTSFNEDRLKAKNEYR